MQFLPHPMGLNRPVTQGPIETIHAVAQSLDQAANLDLLDSLLNVWVNHLDENQLPACYAEVIRGLSQSENLSLIAVYQTDDSTTLPESLVDKFPLIQEDEIRREAIKLAEGMRLTELAEQGLSGQQVREIVLDRLTKAQQQQAAQAALLVYAHRYSGTSN